MVAVTLKGPKGLPKKNGFNAQHDIVIDLKKGLYQITFILRFGFSMGFRVKPQFKSLGQILGQNHNLQ